MRVTLLSKQFPPQISGIGDHTDHLAGELARQGNEVTVVTSQPAEPRDAFEVRAAVERWDARGYRRIARAVAETRPDAILWQYNPFSFGRHGVALGVGRLARGLARSAPLTVVLHELWFPWRRDGARGFVWAVTQRLEAFEVLAVAKKWVVTTESRERELAVRSRGKLVRIPVGANVMPVRSGDDVRAPLGIPRDAFVLVHLGSAGPGRDFAPVFAALEELRKTDRDVRLLLAGETGPLNVPKAIETAVHTTGRLHRDGLSRALRASDAYIHPDHAGPSAGRRTTIVAALAHGLPVISYRGPDAAAELTDGRNVVLVDANPEALAAAIGKLASNPGKRQAMSQAAERTYREHFSWERIGRAFVAVLEESR